MRRAPLLVTTVIIGLAAAALHDPLRDFIAQDRCLDAGGRWIAVDRRCDFGMGVPLR